ncbi:MAG TPA: hypothetical protein VL426_05730 [Candidatus Binatia bacterium]|jgi:hypothetical protein|nr:hypothetical protein [Candidatus Binatia bacterium]
MTRTTRRETNRLRAEIMEGLAEYLDERARAPRPSRVESRHAGRCGTLIDRDAMPDHWLKAIVRECAPNVFFVPELRFGVSRHLPLLH